jgi:succinate dehydrogenase/fumarate reductase flavoprotein subunit
MDNLDGVLIDTDVLVIGGGAGGLLAALSAKRHGPAGTRVTLVDSWLIGRTGHTAFSNAWQIVVLPDDDLDGILREIVAGNDGIADQILAREVLADSYARLKDFEAMGMIFARDEEGRYKRRPTRGLDIARVLYPGRRARICVETATRGRERGSAVARPPVHHRSDPRRHEPRNWRVGYP